MTDKTFQPTHFTPKRTEEITGVSVMTQRNLRRAGHVEKSNDGWSRHSAHELATLLVFNELDMHGIPVGRALKTAEHAAKRITIFAYRFPGAAVDENGGKPPHPPIIVAEDWNERFLVCFGNDQFAITPTLDRLFYDDDGTTEHSVLLVLDLARLGKKLAERAGEPLAIYK